MTATPAENTEPVEASVSGAAPKIEKYFRAMMKADASDLHLKPDRPPYIRVRTIMTPVRSGPLTNKDIESMVFEMMSEKLRAEFIETGNVDLAYELPNSDRFRINVYRQRGIIAVAVRRVTRSIPDLKDLNLPQALADVADRHQGLVLLSGPTGSGKSTTIASMLEHVNKTRPCHVVTIEDPIEYLYEDKKALINQREIGIDVETFSSALRALMREDPDVVLIGEMRDRETFQAALQVSETGHLVFGTIHASGASQTIGRILDLFPSDSRPLIRQSLAFNLRAVICQMLLPSVADGIDRVPALEIMLSNPTVRQLILEERDAELPEVIRAHQRDGMQSFTQSLLHLIEKEYVDPKVAYDAAPNADELKMLMKGISAGHAGLVGRG